MKGLETSPSVTFSEILDNLNDALMGVADARKGRIGVLADAIYANLGDTTNVGPTRIETDAQLLIAGGGVHYRLGPWNLDAEAGASGPTLVVDPYVDARYTYLDTKIKFRRIERKISADKHWSIRSSGAHALGADAPMEHRPARRHWWFWDQRVVGSLLAGRGLERLPLRPVR